MQNLPEYKRFEHFTAYVIVRGEYSESFDTHDVVVGDQAESSKGGSDTGIDGIGIIVNGFCKDVFRELPMEFAVEAQKLLGVSLEGSVG